MRAILRLLFSTGPWFGLTIGCLGLALAVWMSLQYRDAVLGYTIAGIGFSWSLLTFCVPHQQLRGVGIMVAVVLAVTSSGLDGIGDAMLAALWVIVYLGILVAYMAMLLRDELKRANHVTQLLKEERVRAGRNPITGERL